jgi:hypothetical protein
MHALVATLKELASAGHTVVFMEKEFNDGYRSKRNCVLLLRCLQVVATLKELASAGHTVVCSVCSIHSRAAAPLASLTFTAMVYVWLLRCLQVVATLKELASAGHTVVCSIHQPRSSIFCLVKV